MVTRRSSPGAEAAGTRALLVLRVVAVATTVVFFGAGAVTSITGDQEPDLPMEIWILPPVASLVVLIMFRDPRRRVPELSYTISTAAGVPALFAGLGFVDGVDPILTSAFLIGAVTLVLSYRWRGSQGVRR